MKHFLKEFEEPWNICTVQPRVLENYSIFTKI